MSAVPFLGISTFVWRECMICAMDQTAVLVRLRRRSLPPPDYRSALIDRRRIGDRAKEPRGNISTRHN